MIRQSAMSCPCLECTRGVSGAHGFPALVMGLRDPRKARGRRHPLPAVLLVALCALACGFDSYRAMGQWAAGAPQATLVRLGFPARGVFAVAVAPSGATIRRLVQAVLPGGLEVLLRAFRSKAQDVAVDGKCLRGSRDQVGDAVMVLGAMLADGTLAAQQRVPDKTNEITGFAALLAALDLEEAVVTADALHCQRDHARVLVEEFGAHYAFTVKRNQPELWSACRAVPWERVRASARTTTRGHGRVDTRVVEAVTWDDLEFPHVRQVVRITRYRRVVSTGKRSRERVYVITDLASGQADPRGSGRLCRVNGESRTRSITCAM